MEFLSLDQFQSRPDETALQYLRIGLTLAPVLTIAGHRCPVNSLSLRERVGVRESIIDKPLFYSPLILAFSLGEKEFPI